MRFIPRDRGMTVIEVLISFGIASMLLAGFWGARTLARRGELASERDAALQVAILTQQRMEADLRRLLTPPGRKAFSIGVDGSRLSFWVLDPARTSGPELPALPVAYGDGLRWIGSQSRKIGSPYLETMSFAAPFSPVGTILAVQLEFRVPQGKTETSFSTRFQRRIAVSPDIHRPEYAAVYPFEPRRQHPPGYPVP